MKTKKGKSSGGEALAHYDSKSGKFRFKAELFGDDSGFVSFSKGKEVLYQNDGGKIKNWINEVKQLHEAYGELCLLLSEVADTRLGGRHSKSKEKSSSHSTKGGQWWGRANGTASKRRARMSGGDGEGGIGLASLGLDRLFRPRANGGEGTR